MKQISFNSVIPKHSLVEGLLDDGIIMSNTKNANDEYLFVVGVFLSLESCWYRQYTKFTILKLSASKINSTYIAKFGESKFNTKRDGEGVLKSPGYLLYEILKDKRTINNELMLHTENLKSLGIRNIKTFTIEQIKTIIKQPNEECNTKY